ncbi:H-2 class II histocompatibility antigen, I-E beta chain-like isoform X2 [Hoplias malabaricus]
MRGELERYCKHNLPIFYSNILDKTVSPRVELKAEQQPRGAHMSMLMCSAYDFYPPAIDVYWQRDGKKVTTDVTATDELADGDWYYQVHSHLEYTPRSGEKISCVVEHASFSEPMVYDWDPSLPESERSKMAIGASGLVLGLILSAAGFIYYKKKSSGRILVPS